MNDVEIDGMRQADHFGQKLLFPAGGRRLIQKVEGYRATLVAGIPTFENGEATGALPGAVVRGLQAPLAS